MKKYKQIDWSLVTIPIIVVFGLSFLLEHFPKNSQLILEGIRSFLNNQLSFLYILVDCSFLSVHCTLLFQGLAESSSVIQQTSPNIQTFAGES